MQKSSHMHSSNQQPLSSTEYSFENLVKIMERLRVECPWDREQTHDSIKGHTIEEAFEVVEAIDDKNHEELKNELGDLLLHVVFHSEIARGEERFSIDDVVRGISEKLIRRHPHVFGETIVANSHEVKQNWEQIKMGEGRESVIDGVPRSLPALLKAHRIQDKASKIGFDWQNKEQVWKKIEEEIEELKEAIVSESHAHIEEEFGDLLFALVNYARFVRVNPEDALRRTIDKFAERFRYIEKRMKEEGKDILRSSLDEMDVYWEEAKAKRVENEIERENR